MMTDTPIDTPIPFWKFRQRWTAWRATQVGRLVAESFRLQGHLYAVAIVAMIFVAATSTATAWIMEKIIDSLSNPENRSAVYYVAGGVVVLFLAKSIASYIQSLFLAKAGNRVVAMQQERVYRKILNYDVAFFTGVESSDLLMRVTHGAQAARQLIDVLMTSYVRDTLTLIGLVGVMIYQQPFLSIVCFIVGPIAIFGVRYLLKSVREIMEAEMMSLAEIIKVLQETSTGIKIIKVFALEERMIARMNKAILQVETRANDIARLQSIAGPLMETLAGLAIAGVVVASTMTVFGGEPRTAGQLMSFVTALMMAYEPAKRLSRMRVTIEALMVGVKMLFTLLDEDITMKEAENPVDLKPGKSRITFENVSFGYLDEKPVLSDMNLTFESGQTTALVGPSGGGKSTVLSMVLRFYDPNTGAVKIDGQDLRDVSFESLRHKISYVGQDTFLFSSTVMDNLLCSRPDATEEEVIAAAKAAHAHHFITELSNGSDTHVRENGIFLSGGQKKRQSIARAILPKSDLLLLDEATSALDVESEALVKQALDELRTEMTIIVIAHRLSTVLSADKIVVVEQGHVAEQGPVEELLEKGDGSFRRLYDKQFA
jgi:ATP-binding cassette subfamily B protein